MLKMSDLVDLNVSRETEAAVETFEALVRRWNQAINLVSKASVPHLHERHTLDSAALFAFCPDGSKHWVDLGSGGGFPGIVIAILAREQKPGLRVSLVESDTRKATFLRTAAHDLGLQVTVLNQRIESLPPLAADVVSARALAPLTDLLAHAERHLRKGGTAIFPKGVRHSEELANALTSWEFEEESHPSPSEPGAAILVIRNIERARKD